RRDKDNERCFVDDAVRWRCAPIRGDCARLLYAVNVALDGKDRDVSVNALNNLVRDCLRSREGRGEMHVLAVLLLPLRSEGRTNLFLQNLLHYGEAIDGNVPPALACRRLRQTTPHDEQREERED